MPKDNETLEKILRIPDEDLIEQLGPIKFLDSYLITATIALLPTVVFVMNGYTASGKIELLALILAIISLVLSFFFLVWNNFRMNKRIEKYKKRSESLYKKYEYKYLNLTNNILKPLVKFIAKERLSKDNYSNDSQDQIIEKLTQSIEKSDIQKTMLDVMITMHQSYMREQADLLHSSFLEPIGNESNILVFFDKTSFSLRYYTFVLGIGSFFSAVIIHILTTSSH